MFIFIDFHICDFVFAFETLKRVCMFPNSGANAFAKNQFFFTLLGSFPMPCELGGEDIII